MKNQSLFTKPWFGVTVITIGLILAMILLKIILNAIM